MNPALIIRNRAPGKRLRRFFWMHPEWWSLLLVAVAWGLVLSRTGTHGGHAPRAISFPVEFLNWYLMVVAMMVPLVFQPLRWVAFQSFYYRRRKAILFFLLGFVLPWMIAGAPVAWLLTHDWIHNPFLASGMFGLAALWVLVKVRTRALVFCHLRVPLAPSGWHADYSCLRFGLLIGASCVVTCGFLMLGCALTGHNLIAMLGGFILGVIERRSFRLPTRPVIVGTVLLAVLFFPPISNTLP